MVHSANFRAWTPWDCTLGAPLAHIQLNALPSLSPHIADSCCWPGSGQLFLQEGSGKPTPSPSV